MRAIFIAAGRGRRLMPTTADSPKCYAEVQGRRMLDWGLEAFAANQVDDICFIGGYQIDKVKADYPHFTFRHNADWENNNILASLMHAEDLMSEPFICCYSDILFTPDLVKRLLTHSDDITVAVDTGWMDRYTYRTQHPPNDAEKVTVQNGRLTRIHRDIDPSQAYGEYTGIAKFNAAGAERLKKQYHGRRKAFAGKPFREAVQFEKAYLIHLFQDMIETGATFKHSDTAGQYMEVDTQQDFELAQKYWKGAV